MMTVSSWLGNVTVTTLGYKKTTKRVTLSADLKYLCSNVYGSKYINKDLKHVLSSHAVYKSYVTSNPVDNLKFVRVWFNSIYEVSLQIRDYMEHCKTIQIYIYIYLYAFSPFKQIQVRRKHQL
jgi:hypothetical protein